MVSAKKINRWPDFQGQPAASYERHNGKRCVLFGDDVSAESGFEVSSRRLHQSRVGYEILGNKAIFLGMLLNDEHRGSGQGERLIEYFIENVGATEGEFSGTGLIHKPVISLQLANFGLRAVDDDYQAVLLPRSKYDKYPDSPNITVLDDRVENRLRVVESVDGNRFYRVIDPTTAKYTFPSGGREILLHTAFTE